MPVRPIFSFPSTVTYGTHWEGSDGCTYRIVILDNQTYKMYKQQFLHPDRVDKLIASGLPLERLGGYDQEGRPIGILMSEAEWRDLGLQMSAGWIHSMLWAKEPNMLVFRRPTEGRDSQAGKKADRRRTITSA